MLLASFVMNSNLNKFICPECGSKKIQENFHYQNKSGTGLYSTVLHEIQCGSCFMDVPGHLGERLNNISVIDAKKDWINNYKPQHLIEAAKCCICDLYYYEIEKKLNLNFDTNKNIFMQKFTKDDTPDLICRICEPENFK